MWRPRGNSGGIPPLSIGRNLLGSWIELGEDFYQALLEAPVPMDMRTLRALKQSPLALDLYTWLAYRCFTVTKKGNPAFVSWTQLQRQMGSHYHDTKNFKRRIQKTLGTIRTIYPRLKIECVYGGLRLSPGPLLIAPR